MRAFHDSRNIDCRAPYGAVVQGAGVTLSLDVFDAPGATVTLRTWIDGQGEGLYPMDAATPTHFEVVFTPQAAGVVWYHFIITATDGSQKRYGALDGKRGGKGQLYDWEPPSFQLTVFDANQLHLLPDLGSEEIGRGIEGLHQAPFVFFDDGF